MDLFLFIVGLVAMLIAVGLLVLRVFTKEPKKKLFVLFAVGFLVLVTGALIGGANMTPEEIAANKEKRLAKYAAKEEKLEVERLEKEEKEQKELEEKLQAEKEVKEKEEKEIAANKEQEKKQAEIDKEAKEQKEKELVEKEKKKKEMKEQLNFSGKLTSTASNGKITIEIDTNVPDGGVFEVLIIDGNLDMLSDFLVVKDKKITKDFEVPSDWSPSYVATSAMFRFNADEHPQPDDIKKVYGEKGEKMTGDLAAENNLGGNNATIEGETIAYPSEQAVKDSQEKFFNEAITEAIALGNGVIVDINSRGNNTWELVNIVVSDVWYYSADHEQERFVENVGPVIETLVTNSGKVSGSPMVYFIDSYGKDVATPKVLGGWKIKK